MEVEVGVGEAEQVLDPGEGDVLAAEPQGHLPVLAAVDLLGGHREDEVDGLGDALLEPAKVCSVSSCLGILQPGEARHGALGGVAGDLHLPGERKHVGDQPHAAHDRGIDLPRLAVRLRLVEQDGEIPEHVGEARRARLVHRDLHVGSGLGT